MWTAKTGQADASLCWAHSHFVGFVMRRLYYNLLTFVDICLSPVTVAVRHLSVFFLSRMWDILGDMTENQCDNAGSTSLALEWKNIPPTST